MMHAATERAAAIPHLPSSVIDEAIGWAVKLDFNTPSTETRQAFDRWLANNPVHANAWQRVQSLKTDFSALPPKLAMGTLQMAEAQRRARGLNRRQSLKLLSLAGVTAATAWAVHGHAPWQRLLADASTATGEQRTLQLDDGTVIVLNTDSAVRMAMDARRRLIVLQRGEVLITTGADAAATARAGAKRPFWVQTPFGMLQALGTRFVVRLDAGRARISVQEGAVRLHPADGGSPATVQAGENGWLAATGAAPAPAPAFDTDGWADGVVAGKNMRLADLLQELARYRSGRIVCDARVAELRVSGVYQVHDTDQALLFLVQTQPLSVVYRTRFWVSVGPDSSR